MNNPAISRLLNGASVLVIAAGAAVAVSPALAQDQDQTGADGTLEEVVVTAQRRSESIQDVPVAVTAFSAESFDRLQLENFSDLAFFTPNVTFSKTNFTSSNFQIRGVGNALVAGSSDSGVGINVNDVPLVVARLFETEYFDVDSIEILRGPQGTLYGRNATSGTVNMRTSRPVMGESLASLEGEYGNYDSKRFEGMVNVPIGERMAVRLAANYVKRDGYSQNVATGNDIDGRDSMAFRASFAIQPTDTTRINFMVSWFDEESNRTRSQKTLCHNDPVGILGCLPDTLEFETQNGFSTLGVLLSSDILFGALNPALAPLALFQTANGDPAAGSVNPTDLRQVAIDFEPVYRSDELLFTGEIQQDFGENYTATIVVGYQTTNVFSQTDYTMDLTPGVTLPALLPFAAPLAYNTFYAGGTIPVSAIDEGTWVGLLGGHLFPTSGGAGTAYDQSDGGSEQWSVEARIASDLDGPFNFQAGVLVLNYDSDFSYFVNHVGLDYFAAVLPELVGFPGLGYASPYYHSDTDRYRLKSWAIFGDFDYDISETLKLSGGLRFTKDTKDIRDRQTILDTFFPYTMGLLGANPFFENPVDPSIEPTLYRDTFAGTDPSVKFSEITGRVVLNWTPDLAATDDTLIYLSYSRGYKGGGFNPPFDAAEFPNQLPTFEPEFINAFEIGMKNTLMNGRMNLNLTAFYYDYKNLQVSKIVNRTSFNENIDAKIYGLEAEFLYAPDENWLFNANVATLESKIGDQFSVDPRDPVQGDPGYVLIKDIENASNCAIKLNGLPVPIATLPVPGQANGGAFSSCEALLALEPLGYEIVDGLEVSLKGNELRQAPNFTMNIGAQYTFHMGSGARFTVRADYYRQGSMYGRIFNRPIDRIKGWDTINMKATLNSANDTWSLSAFVQNLANDDNITGHYLTDASSGNFTNIFVLEPRRFGVILGYNF